MEINKSDLDRIYKKVMKLYKKKKLTEKQTDEILDFLSHLGFMHVLLGIKDETYHKDLEILRKLEEKINKILEG